MNHRVRYAALRISLRLDDMVLLFMSIFAKVLYVHIQCSSIAVFLSGLEERAVSPQVVCLEPVPDLLLLALAQLSHVTPFSIVPLDHNAMVFSAVADDLLALMPEASLTIGNGAWPWWVGVDELVLVWLLRSA